VHFAGPPIRMTGLCDQWCADVRQRSGLPTEW
jgi:hypothetical protein